MTVSEAAEKYVYLNNPGAYVGKYLNSQAFYMVEPQDTLTDRGFEGEIFVGPAQSGKTQSLILNFVAYTTMVDPMDAIIFSPTQGAARDFSIRRIDRMYRESVDLKSQILPDRDADNVYDKRFKSGVMLSLGHPTVAQFAGRPVGRLMLTDYDRMDDDIGGDGSPYDLASKRATTFGSFAMTLAESSPSRPLKDNRFIRTSPHEAPPTTGILALYNRGDRRRWYWPCLHCEHWFEATFRNLKWDGNAKDAMDAGKSVRLVCPSCGGEMKPDDREELNARGVWLKDGESIVNNQIVGKARRSRIASFWLNGVAAAFVTWQKLVSLFIDAEEEFRKTGSEDALKKFYNNDLGEPYLKKQAEIDRLPEVLKARAYRMPEREVPTNARFLVAAIDVQKNMFIVQVYAVLPGTPFDLAVVDRFRIVKSETRFELDGDAQWVRPSTYLEDWNLITKQVIQKTYPLSDGSGRHMMIKLTVCDSGGEAGVTSMAYNYWRELKKEGYTARFHLIKGVPNAGRPRVTIDYPEVRKDRFSGARGDVPVMFLNSNLLKDDLLGRLDCTEPGKGMIHMPDWLPNSFFSEMCAEVRGDDGWTNRRSKGRNEAWDLTYYAIGACISPMIRIERQDWNNPPAWCGPWDVNPLVIRLETPVEERFAQPSQTSYDIRELAKILAS